MIEHRNHHESHHALGTSGHTHHRGMVDLDGIRVGFWRCDLSTAVDRHCLDEPDPEVRWAEKVLTLRRGPAPAPIDPDAVCDRHDPSRWRLYSERSGRVCLSCRGEKRRIERIARRLARDAARVA